MNGESQLDRHYHRDRLPQTRARYEPPQSRRTERLLIEAKRGVKGPHDAKV
jgi:hypothetical protein